MNLQQKEFLKFIKLLNDNSCIEHVVLIGSWVEFVYREAGILGDFNPSIKTLDVDFLVKNLRKPSKPINLMGLAEQEGYLVEQDIMYEVTRIYDKNGLEIEFLLGKVGAGNEVALKTNLGVVAQTLWHMNIIKNNTIKLPFFNMMVEVPTPEAYAVHKIIINNQRNKKQEKDRRAIINLWPYLNEEELSKITRKLTKKELRSYQNFIEQNNL